MLIRRSTFPSVLGTGIVVVAHPPRLRSEIGIDSFPISFPIRASPVNLTLLLVGDQTKEPRNNLQDSGQNAHLLDLEPHALEEVDELFQNRIVLRGWGELHNDAGRKDNASHSRHDFRPVLSQPIPDLHLCFQPPQSKPDIEEASPEVS